MILQSKFYAVKSAKSARELQLRKWNLELIQTQAAEDDSIRGSIALQNQYFFEAVQIRGHAMGALGVLKSQFTSASDIVQTYHCQNG